MFKVLMFEWKKPGLNYFEPGVSDFPLPYKAFFLVSASLFEPFGSNISGGLT